MEGCVKGGLMKTEVLWMDEDELRAEIERMEARLFWASVAVQHLMEAVEDAARDGYVAGYAEAALRVQGVVSSGDQGCVVLH